MSLVGWRRMLIFSIFFQPTAFSQLDPGYAPLLRAHSTTTSLRTTKTYHLLAFQVIWPMLTQKSPARRRQIASHRWSGRSPQGLLLNACCATPHATSKGCRHGVYELPFQSSNSVWNTKLIPGSMNSAYLPKIQVRHHGEDPITEEHSSHKPFRVSL